MVVIMVVLVVFGGVLQILGLVCAAVGLGQAWAENPKREKLLWRIFGSAIRWVSAKLLRRRSGVAHGSVAFGSAVAVGSSAHATLSLRAGGTTTEWIQQLKAEVDAASLGAQRARNLAERANAQVDSVERRLVEEIDLLRIEFHDARKAATADAVPLAAVGLAVTAVGSVLGLIGSLLPS
jgi:hypothetical protein